MQVASAKKIPDDIAIVTLTKNPYAWLLSLYQRPYHQYYKNKPDFFTFLNMPWKTTRKENTERLVSNPIELWNLKNRAYLTLPKNQTANLTSESVLDDPASVIDHLSQTFAIQKKSEEFTNYERSTKDPSKSSDYYQNYYKNELWKNKLPESSIELINSKLDPELMKHFGYKILTPA